MATIKTKPMPRVQDRMLDIIKTSVEKKLPTVVLAQTEDFSNVGTIYVQDERTFTTLAWLHYNVQSTTAKLDVSHGQRQVVTGGCADGVNQFYLDFRTVEAGALIQAAVNAIVDHVGKTRRGEK